MYSNKTPRVIVEVVTDVCVFVLYWVIIALSVASSNEYYNKTWLIN